MPQLTVTEDEIIALLSQLDTEAQVRVLNRFAVASKSTESETPRPIDRPRPKRGKWKHAILFMADDFDAPLEDMKEYME